jgi:hypothetical protein
VSREDKRVRKGRVDFGAVSGAACGPAEPTIVVQMGRLAAPPIGTGALDRQIFAIDEMAPRLGPRCGVRDRHRPRGAAPWHAFFQSAA